jgi:hypothetical protein
MIDLIQTITSMNYKGDLNAIIFEDNPATSKNFGDYFDPGRLAVINLHRHFQNTLETLKDEKSAGKDMSIETLLWSKMINTVAHEIFHNEFFKVERESPAQTEYKPEEIEELVKDAAFEMILDIAKEYNIEAPAIAEWGFIEKAGMAAALLNELTEANEVWTKRQKTMKELNLILNDEEEKIFLTSLRDWYKGCTTDKNRATWPNDVKPLVEVPKEDETEIIAAEPLTADDLLIKDDVGNIGVTPDNNDFVPGSGVYNEHPEYVDDIDDHGDDTNYINPAECFGTQPFQAFSPVQVQAGFAPVNSAARETSASVVGFTPTPQVGNLNVTTLPVLQIGIEAQVLAINSFLIRLFDRMFNTCGFRPGLDNPFAAPQNIYEPVFIGDIPHIKDLVVSADMEDPTGIHRDVDIWNRHQTNLTGTISGIIFKKTAKTIQVQGGTITEYPIPGFRFSMNKGGRLVKRLFLAQNVNKPNKTGTNYSDNALKARAGSKIAWLMNADANDGTKTFIAKMVDGRIEAL